MEKRELVSISQDLALPSETRMQALQILLIYDQRKSIEATEKKVTSIGSWVSFFGLMSVLTFVVWIFT